MNTSGTSKQQLPPSSSSLCQVNLGSRNIELETVGSERLKGVKAGAIAMAPVPAHLKHSVEVLHKEYWSVRAECLKLNASNEHFPFWERTFEILSQSLRSSDQIRAAARKLAREHQTADIGGRLTLLDQQSEELLREFADALAQMPSVIEGMRKIAENQQDIWEFAPKRYPKISSLILRYPKISLNTNKSKDIFYGYQRISLTG
jgi:hypothetical protein